MLKSERIHVQAEILLQLNRKLNPFVVQATPAELRAYRQVYKVVEGMRRELEREQRVSA